MKTEKAYVYNGCVYQFNNIICNNWHATTIATSQKKALSNISYQFKKAHGLTPMARIRLESNKITEV